MEQSDQVYIELQKHLDSQAVGLPATKTGVDIRVLKHIFTPQEAEIASFLSYKFVKSGCKSNIYFLFYKVKLVFYESKYFEFRKVNFEFD